MSKSKRNPEIQKTYEALFLLEEPREIFSFTELPAGVEDAEDIIADVDQVLAWVV